MRLVLNCYRSNSNSSNNNGTIGVYRRKKERDRENGIMKSPFAFPMNCRRNKRSSDAVLATIIKIYQTQRQITFKIQLIFDGRRNFIYFIPLFIKRCRVVFSTAFTTTTGAAADFVVCLHMIPICCQHGNTNFTWCNHETTVVVLSCMSHRSASKVEVLLIRKRKQPAVFILALLLLSFQHIRCHLYHREISHFFCLFVFLCVSLSHCP